MKKGSITALLCIAGGAVLLSYPSYVDNLYRDKQTQMVAAYSEQLEEMHPTTMELAREAAMVYNEILSGERDSTGYPPLENFYYQVLDIGGIMGSIEIPKIAVHICIFHGTSDATLQRGVGHLETSHLPIGGSGTHSVLTAHSGDSSRMFTDLHKVEQEDVFYLHVLEETLAYQVDQIQVVLPFNQEALLPEPEQDYVTLVTCTPYAINSHRLLVRGRRIPYEENAYRQSVEEGILEQGLPWQYCVSAVMLAGCVLAFGATLYSNQKQNKHRRGEKP